MRDRSRLTAVGQKVVRGVRIGFWRVCSWFFFGVLYCGIEILWRGYTHWTMGVLACVICIPLDIANDTVIPWETPLWLQAIIGGTIITAAEFIAGCIVNLWLGWDVWDYSNMPFNVMGQICLPFTILWIFVSLLAILVDDQVRYRVFGEEVPRYYSIILKKTFTLESKRVK